MGNFDGVFSAMGILFVIVPILSALIFLFAIGMMFSPRLRAKMMGKQVKAAKYMMEENKDDLTDILTAAGDIAVKSGKNILDVNEGALTDMATKSANISKEGIEISARAIKKGFTEEDKEYCKHCGETIDKDSTFCKKCGKQQ